jgi:hypothetical protein
MHIMVDETINLVTDASETDAPATADAFDMGEKPL